MAPVTLSKSQFLTKRPGGSYSKYLGYVNKRRSSSLGAANADPLGQLSPAQISAQVNRYSGMYGTPMTDDAIQSSAKAQLDPIVAAITGDINSRAKTSADAIGANSAALQKELGGIDFAAPYRTAKVDQANVDAALREALASKGGSGLADDLSSRLAMIDDPSVAAAATGLADRGTALGTTELARGTTNLGELIASEAAAREYGTKMPGIARLSGLQDIAGVNKQAVSDIGDATTQLEQQLPTIVANLRNSRDSVAANRAQAAAQLYETLTGQNITKATAKAGLIGDEAKATAAAAPMYDSSVSNSLGYRADQYGNPVGDTVTPLPGYHVDQKTGNVVKEEKPGTARGVTANHRADLVKQAAKDAEDLYHGVADKNGRVVAYTQRYPDAIKILTGRYGSVLTPIQIRALADRWYKPGEYGRPRYSGPGLTKGQQAAVTAAFNPVATLIGR